MISGGNAVDSLPSFLANVSARAKDWKALWMEKRAKDNELATHRFRGFVEKIELSGF